MTGKRKAVRIGRMSDPPFQFRSSVILQADVWDREGSWWWAIMPWAETNKIGKRDLNKICLQLNAEGLGLDDFSSCWRDHLDWLGRVNGKVYVINPCIVGPVDSDTGRPKRNISLLEKLSRMFWRGSKPGKPVFAPAPA
ncbi:MAG: hypothetical protein PHY92_06970 [Alphaproteobacteria bacterium]|nr:hypothetical protein [Alphaproteobacteria bacterium]